MSDNTLAISEMFHSIQGEGRYAGVPSVFLRKSYCNLRCGGWHNDDIENQEDMHPSEDATWVCDSIEVFSEPELKDTIDMVVYEMRNRGLVDPLQNGSHLILTGGEPTMPDVRSTLVDLVQELDNPFTEVETNGTLLPGELSMVIDQWNVSPKLSNSGMGEERRINPEALNWHARNPSSDFKFVVSSKDDVPEIMDIIHEYSISYDDVFLMPSGGSRERIYETAPRVSAICQEHGFRYSPRLQVDIYDEATGV